MYAPQGLTAFAISSNVLGVDDPTNVENYVDEMGLTMTTLVDYDVRLYDDYRLSETTAFAPYPREFIVDRDGTIAYAAATLDPAALAEVLDELLN